MKVKDLLALLTKLNPEAEVIIHRDCQNYGFGFIDRVRTGVFEKTDYGNDFYPDQEMIIHPAQVKSICIFPEDNPQEPTALKSATH